MLWVKTSSLGDVVHGLYAVNALHRDMPHIQIDTVVEADYAPLAQRHPAIRTALAVPLRRWLRRPWSAESRSAMADFYTRLGECGSYDLVIDGQGLFKSALLIRGVRKRVAVGQVVGYDRSSIREPAASFFYDRRVRASRNDHAIARMRTLCAAACQLDDLSEPVWQSGLERTQSAENGEVLLLHGAGNPRKSWPHGWWLQLARLLQERGHRLACVWGNAEERATADALAEQGVTAWGRLPLDELHERMRGIAGYVGPDSGLAHLAASMDIPGVMLYRCTDADLTAPRGKNQVILHESALAADALHETVANALSA